MTGADPGDEAHRERDTAAGTLEALLLAIGNRLTEVTIAKVKGVKARRGTRHWVVAGQPASTKALDAGTVVDPDVWEQQVIRAAMQVLGPAGVTTGNDMRQRLRDAGIEPGDTELAPVDEQPPPDAVPPQPPAGGGDGGDAHPILDYAIIRAVRWLAASARMKAQELRDKIAAAEAADLERQRLGKPTIDGVPTGTDAIVAAIREWQTGPDGDTGLASWARTRAEAAATATVEGVRHGVITNLPRDVTVTRTWRTRRDSRVREAHALAEGQTVDGDEPFEVGGERLRYPGDPLGSPGNVINCRCHAPWAIHGLPEAKSLFDSAKHPRDAHGRFALVGSLVRILDGKHEGVTGTVVGTRDKRVTLETDDGKRITVDAHELAVTGHATSLLHGAVTEPTVARPYALPGNVDAVAWGYDREASLEVARPFLFGGLGGRDEQGLGKSGMEQQPTAADAIEAKRGVAADIAARMTMVSDADLLGDDYERAMDPDAVWKRDPSSGKWLPYEYGNAADETIRQHVRAGRWDQVAAIVPLGPPQDRLGTGGPEMVARLREQAVSGLVHKWAETSNDHNAWSLAMQQIIADEFGLEDTRDWPMDDELRSQMQGVISDHRPMLAGFVHAQYELTQERLIDAGIDTLNLYRGMHWDPYDDIPEWAKGVRESGNVEVPLRPASAFTADGEQAVNFAGRGEPTEPAMIIAATVPRERILGTPRTGIGCLGEWEFVVLGGTGTFSAVGNALTDDDDEWTDALDDHDLTWMAVSTFNRDDVQRALRLDPPPARRAELLARAKQIGYDVKALPTGGSASGPSRSDVRNEDWLRTLTWDVRDYTDEPITTLDALADRLGTDPDGARRWLRTMPAGEAAPATLKAEANRSDAGREVKESAVTTVDHHWDPAQARLHPRGLHGRFAHTWVHILSSHDARNPAHVVTDVLRKGDAGDAGDAGTAGDAGVAASPTITWKKHLDGLVSEDGRYYIERRISGNRLYEAAEKGDPDAEALTDAPFSHGRLIDTGPISELRGTADRHAANSVNSTQGGSDEQSLRADRGGQLAGERAGSLPGDRGQADVLRPVGGGGAAADRLSDGREPGTTGRDVRPAVEAPGSGAGDRGGNRDAGVADGSAAGRGGAGPGERDAAAGAGDAGGPGSEGSPDGLSGRPDGVGADGTDAVDGDSVQPEPDPSALPGAVGGEDFRPTGIDDLTPAGKAAKLEANMEALRTLRRLQGENRPATPEEQATLARWAGWGGLPEVFDPTKPQHDRYYAELATLLSPAEIREARRNTLNAHYTDARVVESLWRAVGELGFDGGRVLEPGSGSGTFIGFAPDKAAMVGVELDSTTAAISQYLYPSAVIRNESFADTNVPDGSFDATIGNVPFGNFALTDRRHNATGESIHNHFILKSLALTRPGGIVAVLTSRYTLDSEGERARRLMADKADLIGAVRLPTGSHQRASETSVIEDILIFRVREPGEPPQADQSWVTSHKQDIDGQTIPINDYWAAHPDHVLGEVHAEKGRFGTGDLIVRGDRDMTDLPATLDAIVADAKANGLTGTASDREALPELIGSDRSRHEGHIRAEADGKFTQAVGGASRPYDVPAAQADELRDLITLRDTLTALLSAEAATKDDTPQIEGLRTLLNARYDAYVDKYGPINRFKFGVKGQRIRPGQGDFRSDPMSAVVRALEDFDPVTQTAKKSDVFTKRVVAPRELRTTADTPQDALALSMEQYGEVNLPAIAKMLGIDEVTARDRLGTLVYEQPPLTPAEQEAAEAALTAERLGDIDAADAVDLSSIGDTVREAGRLEPSATYLSGNVRKKLAAARAAATHDPRFRANVEALERVIPPDLGPEEIDGRLGASWVDAATVEAFVREILNERVPAYGRANQKVQVATSGGSIWTVVAPRQGILSTQEWGTPDRPAPELIQALLEQRAIKVSREVSMPDGGTKNVPDLEATLAAQEKAQQIQERFGEWLWENPDRARRLQAVYNDRFNAIVLRKYEATPDREWPGMSEDWRAKVHEHVKASAERIVQEPTVLLAHVVGAGKTAEMTMGAMELRRLGLARKPAIVIPNHMLEQFNREFLEIYPEARLLAAGTDDLRGDKRREFVARAATGNWDAVILTQSAFESIPMSSEQVQAYIDREMATMRAQLEEAQASDRSDNAHKRTVKKMEKSLLRAEEALKKKLGKDKDAGVSFEQTGIDYLMVDEAHMYSNLRTLSNIQGAGNEGSDRATDLHMKIEYLRANNTSGRVATFASGTPIRNTVTQAYVMQRFLRPDLLEEAGIHSFDQWAGTFGEVVSDMELKPEGTGFRQTERFARFRNVPELLRLFHTFSDVKMAEDLNLPTPNLIGGKVENVVVPASDELREYVRELGDRADAVRAREVDPTEDNMLKISGDGRKAALSMKLVGQEHQPGKIEAAADRIAQIHKANADRTYGDDELPGAMQIVFLDMGTPGDTAEWNAYDELKRQLVDRGMDAGSIRFIHEAKNDAQKAEMFAAARNGRISVLIGSSEKMGVGTNIQKRAVALHHLDAPWRPADVEQRDGRIMRQGNLNPDVEVIRYVTEHSFDAYMWQTLERKAKFIHQVMRGSLDVREIEDIGDTALNAAEVKALATGNPDMLSIAKSESALTKVQRLERAHNRQQVNMRSELKRYESAIPVWTVDADAYDAAIARRTDTRGDKFTMQVGRDTFTQRTEAADALIAETESVVRRAGYAYNPEPYPVGEIGGQTVTATMGYSGRSGGRIVKIGFAGVPGDVIEVPAYEVEKLGAGVVVRLENALNSFEQKRDRLREAVERGQEEIRRIEARLGTTFPRTAEMEALRARVARLREKMQRDEKRAAGQDIPFDETIDTDKYDDPTVRAA